MIINQNTLKEISDYVIFCLCNIYILVKLYKIHVKMSVWEINIFFIKGY